MYRFRKPAGVKAPREFESPPLRLHSASVHAGLVGLVHSTNPHSYDRSRNVACAGYRRE
jgi:hypothetical protein